MLTIIIRLKTKKEEQTTIEGGLMKNPFICRHCMTIDMCMHKLTITMYNKIK
jgi:hypothetical protein